MVAFRFIRIYLGCSRIRIINHNIGEDMELLLILGGAAYVGIGGVCASRWFHHKDPVSVILVVLFWPLIWGLSWFVK